VLNKGVTKVHYVFSPQDQAREDAVLMIDYAEAANRKKEDRLEMFKK
jgi:hypothetical protein